MSDDAHARLPPLPLTSRALRLRCPHCGLQAMSAWRKWRLGWDRPVPCQACGLLVAVSGWHVVRASLPLVGGAFAVAVVAGLVGGVRPGPTLGWLSVVALISAGGFLFTVPLLRASHADPAAVRRARLRAGLPES